MWSVYSCSSTEIAFNNSDSCLLHTQSSCLCNCVFILKHNNMIVYALCVSNLRWKQLKQGCYQKIKTQQNSPSASQTLSSCNKCWSLTHLLFKWEHHPDTAAATAAVAEVTVPLSSRCFGNQIVVSSIPLVPLSIHRYHLIYALCSSFTPSLLSLLWHNSLFALLFNSLSLSLSPCALPLSWCLSELAGDKVICGSSELS